MFDKKLIEGISKELTIVKQSLNRVFRGIDFIVDGLDKMKGYIPSETGKMILPPKQCIKCKLLFTPEKETDTICNNCK